jgi:rhodanese-related sulfurtransferase
VPQEHDAVHALNYNVALPMDFIQNNILLIAVAFASGAMLIWPFVRRTAGGPWVNTLRATQMINREDALLIDVRDAAEYAKGHILGAKNVPLADLERRAAEFDKHKAKPVIVHCDTGSRATRALGVLKGRGFANVSNLAGGYGAWQQAGLPVEK